MQAYHINTRVTEQGEVHLPKLPFRPGQDVEVVVRPFDDDADRREEKAWMAFGLREFLKGYADEDSIYDEV
ncbi:MAG: hypothetical protein ACHQNE_02650 [Candidatus Kapaibacterium sp.]